METINGVESETPTGVFFNKQTTESLSEAITKFESLSNKIITKEACRKNAERFSNEEFKNQFSEIIKNLIE